MDAQKVNKLFLFFITLSLGALLFSCNAAKRIDRICKRNPDVCKKDTQTYHIKDSFIVKQLVTDTTFLFKQNTDTVYLTKDNLIVKYKYNPITKTVYLSGKVLEQKHYFEHKIQVINNGVTIKKSLTDWVWIVLSILGSILIIYKVFKK